MEADSEQNRPYFFFLSVITVYKKIIIADKKVWYGLSGWQRCKSELAAPNTQRG
jgi:hypothetical protein